MGVYSAIDKDELPLETDEFVERVLDYVHTVVDDEGLDEPRFDSQFSEEEMRNGLYTRIHAELMVARATDSMLEDVDNPTIFIQLCQQAEDEFNHAKLLAQRLSQLGGDPSKTFERMESSDKEFWQSIMDADSVIEASIRLHTCGERIVGERHPKEKEFYDEETAKIYEEVITPDERFHAQVGVGILRHQCDDYESQVEALDAVDDAFDMLLLHDDSYREAYSAEAD